MIDEPIRRDIDGAVLWMLPRAEPAVACLEAYVPAGMRREPPERAGVALLTGRTLSEGAGDLDGDEIARRIESVGGELVTTAVGGRVEVAAGDLALGVETLLDCIGRPTFPAERVLRARDRQRTALLAALDDPAEVARQAFDAQVYGAHPFGRPVQGSLETIDALDRDACAAFHRSSFARDTLVLGAAGAFDPDALTEMIAAHLERWPTSATPAPPFPAPPPRAPSVAQVALDGDKSQAHVFLGHLGVRRTDPDFYALLLMDHVLGVSAGFTDRLSRTLRDTHGLAYEVYASITSSAHVEPGTFHAYIGTGPDHVARAVEAIQAEVRRIRDEPIPTAELDDARAFLTGSAVFGYQTVQQLAHYLVDRERFGYGDLHHRLPDILGAIDPPIVQDAARRHLDPDAMTLIVAGPEGTD